jgi:hypothetical protein
MITHCFLHPRSELRIKRHIGIKKVNGIIPSGFWHLNPEFPFDFIIISKCQNQQSAIIDYYSGD